jgi:hypothetical protein
MNGSISPGQTGRKPLGHHPLKPALGLDLGCVSQGLHRRPLKHNENRVFAVKSPSWRRKIGLYFNYLRRKFVTWRINRIFRRINELKPP